MRDLTLLLLLALAIALSGCATTATFDESPKTAAGVVEPLLIEFHFSESWAQDLCYLVTYTPGDHGATVTVTGRRHSRYTLSLAATQQLLAYAENHLLARETGRINCDDCTEFEVLVRVGRRHNFFVMEENADGLPEEVTDLLRIIGATR